jgi:hypothetical protein
MPAVASDSMVPERAGTTRTVVYTTLYDLIAAVGDAVKPSEEDYVAPIVVLLLGAGHAHFLRDVDVEILWEDQAPACLEAEK